MTPSLYLALDQGGHASRALLYDTRGQIQAQAFAPISTRRTAEGYVEHDAEEVLDSVRTAAGDVLAGLKSAPGMPIAAGLATQRSSIVCWHRQSGEPLSPVISWQDRRNARQVQALSSHAARVRTLTGLVLSPHYGASKLRWCLEHLPRVAAAAADGTLACGPLSSFLLHGLLAERPLVVDPANASRTQLWNPATQDWAPELLQWFGIEARHLPQPVPTRHRYGTLQLGAHRVPLAVCTGDQSAAPFAFGPAHIDTAYINLGTGAFIQRPLQRMPGAPLLPAALLESVLHSDEHGVVTALEGTVNGAGSALEWFAEEEGLETAHLLRSLPAAETGLHPPLFLNGISGLGSPFWIAEFPSRFVGEGNAQERFLALLESILFLVRVNLEEMRPHGPPLARLVVTGGLAAADFLCHSLADLTDLPVVRHAEREATARGLAFLTAGQPAHWVTPPAHTFAPRLNTALRERFFAWLKLMKQAVPGVWG